MNRIFLRVLLLLSASLASAQVVGPIAITSAQCAPISTDGRATIGINVSGTWTGTLQPKATIQGQVAFNVQVTPSSSSTPQSTITANGIYIASVAGYSTFQLCGATVASGTATVYLNGSAAAIGGSSAAAGSVAFGGVLPGTNTGALLVGTSGSLSPTGTGQIAGNQLWMLGGIPDPVLTGNASGGNLAANTNIGVKISYSTALGETVASRLVSVSTPAGCGTSCSMTVTAPTLPTWATAYTVYSCQGVSCTAVLQQTAANACVAITGNCIIQTVGAGAAPLTIQTAWVQPPNVQATECPPNVIPQTFVQDVSGNYHTQSGVDTYSHATNGPPAPGGTLTFCRRTWFNDSLLSPPGFNNTFVLVRHIFGTGTVTTNQDRGLSVFATNPTGDSATRYGMEGLQAELDLVGSPTAINGSPDGEVAAVSVQASDGHTTTNLNASNGFAGVRVTVSRPAGATGNFTGPGGVGWAGLLVQMNDTSSGANNYGGNVIADVHLAQPLNNNSTSASSAGLWLDGITTPAQRFSSQNYGIQISSMGSNASDVSIYAAGTGAGTRIITQGNVGFGNTLQTLNGDATLQAGLQATSFKTAQIGAPGAIILGVSQGGTPGATSYTYTVVGKDINGNTTVASNIGTTGAGNATLTGVNFNIITINRMAGVWNWDIYRTVSGGTPSSVGKIGTVAGTLQNFLFNSQTTFNDTGLAGDSTTSPAFDSTGASSMYKELTLSNCASSGGTCANAAAGSVSIAAAATTVTVATNAVTANSQIFVQEDSSLGTRLSVTCNTTTGRTYTVTARTAGTSFVITASAAPAANPACLSFHIVN